MADDVNLDDSSFAGAACEADACGVARDCDDVIDAETCADDKDWHKDGDPSFTCASVEAANARKKWKKKKVDRPRIRPFFLRTPS